MFRPTRGSRRRALRSSLDPQDHAVKLIGIQRAEGGLVVVKPDGTQAIVPQSDDRTRNAQALGELVLEIIDDRAQPGAQTSSGQKGEGGDDVTDAIPGDYKPRIGESADAYVNRVGTELGFRGGKKLWETLQRMSGTKPGGR